MRTVMAENDAGDFDDDDADGKDHADHEDGGMIEEEVSGDVDVHQAETPTIQRILFLCCEHSLMV